MCQLYERGFVSSTYTGTAGPGGAGLVPFQLFAPSSLLGHPTANRRLFGPNLSPDQVGTALARLAARFDAHAGVGNVPRPPLDAIIFGYLARRAQRLVVVGGHAQRRAQLLVEFAQMFELLRQRGKLAPLVGDEKLLIAGVPKPRELPPDEHARHDGHLKTSICHLPEFRAAAVFFNAHNSARAAHLKTFGWQSLQGGRGESFV